MPSPRAVLRDVNDLGLDPNKAHKATTKDGRLSGNKVLAQTAPTQSDVVVPKPEEVVEKIVPVHFAEEVHEPKKNKPPKRVTVKNDEPEEPQAS
jgi:hypothetical protein